VLKVVGAVIRFSIGFEVKRGFRRQQTALSYSAIQRYSRIGSREDLSRSLKHALHCNYIQRVEPGAFDPNAGRLSRAASYGLHWADSQPAPGQSKTRTGLSQEVRSGEPKAVPGEASNSRTGAESNSRTGGGPGTEPAHGSRIRTGLEMHLRNEHCKQQQAAAEVVRDREARLRCLRKAGFDEATSVHLASHALERIQRQIRWMGARTVTRNKLGMLRKAIEQDWPEPNGNSRQLRSDLSPTTRFAKHYYAGLANNRSTPVAHPTEEDILASEPLLRAVQPLSEGTAVELCGLRFGQYVARHGARELGPTGLAAVTRQYGDAFLVSEQSKSEQQLRKRDGEERGLAAELKEKYLHFLRSEEERLREQETRNYEAFLEVRNRQRATLLRLAGGDGHSPLLKSFDSEAGRLSDLQAFFSSQVPTLQAWEATTAVER
jgi:hypothetical protein